MARKRAPLVTLANRRRFSIAAGQQRGKGHHSAGLNHYWRASLAKTTSAGPKAAGASFQRIFRLKKLEFCYRLLPRWSGSLRWNCSTLSAGIRDLPLVIS